MGWFRRRRRRRRRGFFGRLGRAIGRVGRGIGRVFKKHGGKIAGAILATTPLGLEAGLAGGALLDRRNKKRRNKKRQAEAKKRDLKFNSTMPKRITGKDFLNTIKNLRPTPIETHWNPKDGWVKDLNGDGVIDIKDFALAVYPEHKKYIRDWILSHQFNKNRYLDPTQDGVVDIEDYFQAEDSTQKREIKKYVEDRNGSLTGKKITNLIIHMVNDEEKGYIFSAQDEIEHGLRGKDSGAVIRNINIDEVLEYNEAVKRFGTDVGRPMVRGIQWEGDTGKWEISSAIKVIRMKMKDRFSKFFHSNLRPRQLRGQRGTTFRIEKRMINDKAWTTDVTEISPEPDINGFVLILSGDFEHGPGGEVFDAYEDIVGFGDLEGKVRVGVKKEKTKNEIKRKTKRRFGKPKRVKPSRRNKRRRGKKRLGLLGRIRSGELRTNRRGIKSRIRKTRRDRNKLRGNKRKYVFGINRNPLSRFRKIGVGNTWNRVNAARRRRRRR